MRKLFPLLFTLLLVPTVSPASQPWERIDAVTERLGDSAPLSEGLQLELPLVAEDGARVDVSLSFTGTLNEDEHLTEVTLLAPANPDTTLIQFLPTPLFGQHFAITSRVRLSESQTVYAMAHSNQGRSWLGSRQVRVTISGCVVSDPQQQQQSRMESPRVALPRRLQAGQPAAIRTMINHPMDTGLDEDGQRVAPANRVERLAVTSDQQPLLEVNFHGGTASNPYVLFHLVPERSSTLEFTWQDSAGNTVSEQRALTL